MLEFSMNAHSSSWIEFNLAIPQGSAIGCSRAALLPGASRQRSGVSLRKFEGVARALRLLARETRDDAQRRAWSLSLMRTGGTGARIRAGTRAASRATRLMPARWEVSCQE